MYNNLTESILTSKATYYFKLKNLEKPLYVDNNKELVDFLYNTYLEQGNLNIISAIYCEYNGGSLLEKDRITTYLKEYIVNEFMHHGKTDKLSIIISKENINNFEQARLNIISEIGDVTGTLETCDLFKDCDEPLFKDVNLQNGISTKWNKDPDNFEMND